MKKILLSISLIFGFAGYTVYRHDPQLFIKDSEMATAPMKTDSLPNAETADIQRDAPKSQLPIRKSDDENNDDEENRNEGDDEGETRDIRRTQTVSSKTSLPQAQAAQKSSTQSIQMMGMGGNMMMRGQYKNGEYTGKVANAFYGNIQVKAIVFGGKITDVQFLDYPHDRQNSIRINTYAMPILKSEAIKAQSAEVDAVSGASATSAAFKESLSSALSQARI